MAVAEGHSGARTTLGWGRRLLNEALRAEPTAPTPLVGADGRPWFSEGDRLAPGHTASGGQASLSAGF